MAWATEYRGEFCDDRGLIWRADIELDGYAGSINEMTLTGDPLKIEWLAPGDDLLFSPIKGSTATINVWSNTHFQYTSLYSAENLKRRFSIYYIPVSGSTLTVDSTEVTVDSEAYTADDVYASAEGSAVLYWRGYLTADYSEPYDDVPYRVSLTAADGLGLLKDMLYKYTTEEKDDTYYTGRRYESQVVLDILGKLGFTEFKEFCNLYDTNMSSDVGDSPFDQCLIDMDVFKDLYCYEVMEELLKKYNAIIRQINGQFYIFRPTEFDADTCYGRHFTAYDTKTAITCTPEQLIHRTTSSSDIKDFNGGVLMLQPPLSQFTATQDYGNNESWIKNHNIDITTWQGYLAGTNRFTYWKNNYNIGPLGHYSATSKETEGVLFSVGGNLGQTFGAYAKACSDEMIFSFDYLLINFNASTIATCDVFVQIYDSTNAYWLTNSATTGVAEWSTTAYYSVSVTETDIAVGVGSWKTATFRFTGLPIDGPYNIIIGWTGTSGAGVAFKGLRFYSTSDEIVNSSRRKVKARWWDFLIGNNYVLGKYLYNLSTRSSYIDNEEVVERVYKTPDPATTEAPVAAQNYLLGDCENTGITNVIEQYKGSLAVIATGSLVQSAIDFATDFAADYAALSSPGVVLTADNGVLYFESDTAGDDFTGATSISNVSGDLNGTVATVQANVVAVAQVDTVKVNLTSPSGTANITCKGLTKLMTYATSVADTVAAFVAANQAAYAAIGVTLAVHGTTNTWMTFTAALAGASFGSDTTIVNVSGNLSGTVENTTAAVFPEKRKDSVTLTGSSGTANITCHGETNTVTYYGSTALVPTTAWSTRGGAENKPLIEMIADEVAAQYNRERHFIQMNLRERGNAAPDVNMLYNIQDDLNTYGGNRRVFVANRGTFDVLRGEWALDAHEIL